MPCISWHRVMQHSRCVMAQLFCDFFSSSCLVCGRHRMHRYIHILSFRLPVNRMRRFYYGLLHTDDQRPQSGIENRQEKCLCSTACSENWKPSKRWITASTAYNLQLKWTKNSILCDGTNSNKSCNNAMRPPPHWNAERLPNAPKIFRLFALASRNVVSATVQQRFGLNCVTLVAFAISSHAMQCP